MRKIIYTSVTDDFYNINFILWVNIKIEDRKI